MKWIIEDGYLKYESADDPTKRYYLYELKECAGLGRNAEKVKRLIAAAPDLLAALIDVRDNVMNDSPDMWGRVNAAIAKATE
jgi:hypothetical protein